MNKFILVIGLTMLILLGQSVGSSAQTTDPYETETITTPAVQETPIVQEVTPSELGAATDIQSEKSFVERIVAGLQSAFGLNRCGTINWLLILLIIILTMLLTRRKNDSETNKKS